jgi:Flp pilus assembly protein TadG
VHCGNRRKIRDESGQVLILMAAAMVVLLGITGFALDVGHAYLVQRQLQAATDAAALAGALDLPNSAQAIQTAKNYGPEPGKRNSPTANDNAAFVTGYPQTKCVQAIVTGCPANGQVNTITVQSTSVVNTVFARVVGFDSFTVKASSTACSPCSVKPLDIMLVLDRTGSMCQFSNGSNDPACTDLKNARDGMKTFLGLMNPTFHHVGLTVLPPATNVAQRCSAVPNGNNYNYNLPNAAYTVVPLSSDYASAPGQLIDTSNLVSTINCIKGGGRTAYAKAIDEAQAELDRNGRPSAHKVIVLLSDGAANTGDTTLPNSSPYKATPCHQGINSSIAAQDKMSTVYAIGYDLNGSGTDYEQCHPWSWTGPGQNPLESPPITSWAAMGGDSGSPLFFRGIASSYDTFYNQPDPGKLDEIFKRIAADIFRTAQLIDDSLT